MKDIFKRLSAGRPTEPTPKPKASPAHILLSWLQNKWTKPILKAKDIYRLGPNAIRNREIALQAAEVLENRGLLEPLEVRGYGKIWRVRLGLPEDKPPPWRAWRARYRVTNPSP